MGRRILAVDPGSRRVGLAMSDAEGTIASPLRVVEAGKKAIEEIVALVDSSDVSEVVIGYPVSMDGTKGTAAREAEVFASGLRSRLQVPVTLFDERLTSVAAERAMRGTGQTSKQMRGKVDQVAAAILLQSYLDKGSR